MSQPSPQDPFWKLIDAVCSGSIDAEQVGELEELLKHDPVARSLYADYCLMHSEIRFKVSTQRVVDSARKEIEALACVEPSVAMADRESGKRTPSSTKRTPWPMLLATRDRVPQLAASMLFLAIVLFAVVGVPWLRISEPEAFKRQSVRTDADKLVELVDNDIAEGTAPIAIDGFAAQLTGTFQAKWTDTANSPVVRQYLHPNEVLQLRDGMAELCFFSGTKLIIEGPCEFKVDSKNAGTLERGRILVGNSGRKAGFHINTPRAVAIDLGGEFGIEVSESGEAQVHVLDGVVQVALIEGNKPAKSVHLVTNESLLITAKDTVPTKGVADAQRFARVVPHSDDRLDDLLRDCLITHLVFDDPSKLGQNTGIGRDATVQFDPTVTRGVPAFGQAVDFDGDDLRSIDLAAEDVAAFSPGGVGGLGLTVAAWVKTTCIDQRGNVFFAYNADRENADTHRDIVLLELEFGGLPNALVRDEDFGREINLVHHQGIADGTWHHVAITLSAGAEKILNLYVDGELSATKTSRVVNDVSLRRARVGRRFCERTEDDNDFQGVIDELLILNRTLKPSELRWLFNATRPRWI